MRLLVVGRWFRFCAQTKWPASLLLPFDARFRGFVNAQVLFAFGKCFRGFLERLGICAGERAKKRGDANSTCFCSPLADGSGSVCMPFERQAFELADGSLQAK